MVEAISYAYTDDEMRALCGVLGMSGLPGRPMLLADDIALRNAEGCGLISKIGDRIAADRLAAFLAAVMGQAECRVCLIGGNKYLGLFQHYLACIVAQTDGERWILTPNPEKGAAQITFLEKAAEAEWARTIVWGRDTLQTEGTEDNAGLVRQLQKIIAALDSPFEGR